MARRRNIEPEALTDSDSPVEYTVNYPHGLNLRAEPSKQAAVLRVLQHGETVTARDADAPDGWLAVDGGYVMKEFLN